MAQSNQVRSAIVLVRSLGGDIELSPSGEVIAINLVGTAVNEDSLVELKAIDQLKRLYLGVTEIDDSCVSLLSSMKSLEYLSVHGTQMTPEGIGQLRNALPNCQIRPRGAAVPAPAEESEVDTMLENPPKQESAVPAKAALLEHIE
ncbi:MAG: hypothetical protein CMJ78_26185 [Planctomycetaceae bacterium]|nr:hypothetical protein [Planctomycetaceae bacterium]